MDILIESGIHLSESTLLENKKNGRCSGHCCSGFTFPASREDISNFISQRKKDESHHRMERESKKGDPLSLMPSKYPTSYFEELLSMFVDKDREINDGKNPAWDNDETKDSDPLADLSSKENYPGFFDCKHLCSKTGNCNNYENRPDFCRSYPNHNALGACYYEGCTSSCSIKNVKSSISNGEDSVKR